MLIRLQSENGHTIEKSFNEIEEAAKYALQFPEYGVCLYPDNDNEELNLREFQEWLDYYSV